MITLNILSGVFRILGAIFLFIYVKIKEKIVKGKCIFKLVSEILNESLINKQITLKNSYRSSHLSNCYTSSHSLNDSHNKKVSPVNRKSSFLEDKNKLSGEKETKTVYKDLNIFINSNDLNKNGNIHVHVHNYNITESTDRKISANTYDSMEKDDSIYETPKKVSFAN